MYEWSETYALRIGLIDEQHQKLFGIINKVHQAFKGGNEKHALEELLPELIRYTEYHFGAEERLMQEYEFPDFRTHQSEHKTFIEEVHARMQDLDEGKGALSLRVLSFLANWIVKHIGYRDRAFGDYLRKKDPRRFA